MIALAVVLAFVSDGDAGAPDAAPDTRPPDVAPTGRLEGRVLERGTRRPLAGAGITVGITPAGEASEQGTFSVVAPCGRHKIVVQHPGFEILTVEADPCAAAPSLVVRLDRAVGPTYETVVRAPADQPSTALQGDELTRTPGSLGDPFRVLDSLPGVTAPVWPAAIYAVRGANPGNTGFFLDDLRLPGLFHFALGPSVVHPYFFAGMDFYPGGYPARYGRYVGGLVSAQTRAPPSDAFHASVDLRLFDAGALISTPFPDGRGGVAVAGRYSYTGAVVSLLSDDVRLGYWDYQLRADRSVGPAHLTLLVLGSGDRLLPSAIDEPNREIVLRFHRLLLRAAVPAAGGMLAASVGLGTDHSKAPLADQFPVVVDALSAAPRVSFRRPTRHVDVEVGGDGELTRYSPVTSIQRPGALDLTHRRRAALFAAYASLAIRAGALSLSPELRFDHYGAGGASQQSLGPRLGARVALGERTWLQVAGGRFTQTPSLPLQVPGVESFGLALYGLQKSWQGALGVGTRRLGLEASITGYAQRLVLTDLRDPMLENIDPTADDLLTRRDASSGGLELMVRRPATERWHGWLAYTLSRSLRALGGGVIAPSDWDQRHVLNLVVGYRRGRTTLGGRAHLNTGRPVLVTNARGPELIRLPAFHQLDLRVDRRIVFDSYVLELYAELVNATLTRQVFGYKDDGGGRREQSFRLVIPSLGVRGEL